MSTIKEELKAWSEAKEETDANYEAYREALALLQASRDKCLVAADPVKRAILRAGGELEVDGKRLFLRAAKSGDWTSGEVVDSEPIEAPKPEPAKAKAASVPTPTATTTARHSPVHKPATTPAEEIHAPSPATK